MTEYRHNGFGKLLLDHAKAVEKFDHLPFTSGYLERRENENWQWYNR